MSWSLTKVVGLVIIPLMVASAILASLQSINTQTIGPQGDRANKIVNTYGRQVPIGSNVNEEWQANEQMKEMIILNQISAFNCAMIPGILQASRSSPQDPSQWNKNDKKFDYQVYHRNDGKRLFRWLWKARSVPGCTGASQVHLPNVDVQLPSIADIVKVGTLWDNVISNVEDVTGWMTCEVKTTMEKQNGHDMEGVYGRINFNTKMDTKLASSDNDKLWAMSLKTSDDCWLQDEKREIQGLWKGSDVAEFIPFPSVDSKNIKTRKKTGYKKIKHLYQNTDTLDSAGGRDTENKNPGGLFSEVGDPGARLAGEVIVDAPLILPGGPKAGDHLPEKVSNGYYLFCKGVKGYVQSNTIKPDNAQESTRQSTHTLLNIETEHYTGGSTLTYTYVHITSDNRKSCFEEMGISKTEHFFSLNGVQIKYYTPTGVDPYVSGDVTTSPTQSYTGGSSEVVTTSGSNMVFDPAESGDSDFLSWQDLPPGDKTVSLTLEFQEQGHLQIDLQEDPKTSADIPGKSHSNTFSYINTDANVNDNVWIQKPEGNYEDTGFDYSTDTEYVIEAEKNGNQFTWRIKSGGTVQWSNTFTTNGDFRRLYLESWSSWNGNSDIEPEVTIKEVRITN